MEQEALGMVGPAGVGVGRVKFVFPLSTLAQRLLSQH